jgi:hypothetical protein
MGSGTWDSSTYDRVTRSKIASGRTFSYTDDAFSSGVLKAHESLDPLKDGKPTTRESRDSDEHPDSTPIVIGFDVTGSMGGNPALIQESLKELFGMLVRKDIVSDPQIAIGAYGDAQCDTVPLQIGQFESDNRIDDELDNVLIECGGGGNNGETSVLLAKYIADNISTDAWDKRKRKGYVFLIGDERSLDLKASEIRRFMGVQQPVKATAAEVFSALNEKWNVYMLLIDNYSAKAQGSREQYGNLIGNPEHVIPIKDGSLAAPTIASIIGAVEETIDAGSLSGDLIDAGFSKSVAVAASDATVGLYGGSKSGTVDTKVSNDYGDLGL